MLFSEFSDSPTSHHSFPHCNILPNQLLYVWCRIPMLENSFFHWQLLVFILSQWNLVYILFSWTPCVVACSNCVVCTLSVPAAFVCCDIGNNLTDWCSHSVWGSSPWLSIWVWFVMTGWSWVSSVHSSEIENSFSASDYWEWGDWQWMAIALYLPFDYNSCGMR